jgi:hypothetical protein
MKNSLPIALLGVERLHGIGEVMAEHAGGMGRIGKPIGTQVAKHPVVPLMGDSRCAAPIAVGNMDDVILKVTEPCVRVFGTNEIPIVVTNEYVDQPLSRVGLNQR